MVYAAGVQHLGLGGVWHPPREADLRVEMLPRGGVPDGGLDGDHRVLILLREGVRATCGAFFRGLLHFYGLEVTHLKPNLIAQIAIFIHLCDGYLGIFPHFNLWQALYRLKGCPSYVQRNVVGGATFSLCQGRVYPDFELCDTNKGWGQGVVCGGKLGAQPPSA